MDKEKFKQLRGRIARANNELHHTLESCPELEKTYVELPDGHKLFLNEIFSWLDAVRSNFWKYGPTEVQQRHIKDLLRSQPRG